MSSQTTTGAKRCRQSTLPQPDTVVGDAAVDSLTVGNPSGGPAGANSVAVQGTITSDGVMLADSFRAVGAPIPLTGEISAQQVNSTQGLAGQTLRVNGANYIVDAFGNASGTSHRGDTVRFNAQTAVPTTDAELEFIDTPANRQDTTSEGLSMQIMGLPVDIPPYRQGQWLPRVFDGNTGGAVEFSYQARGGFYVRIGQLVFVTGQVTLADRIGITLSNNATFVLPYSSTGAGQSMHFTQERGGIATVSQYRLLHANTHYWSLQGTGPGPTAVWVSISCGNLMDSGIDRLFYIQGFFLTDDDIGTAASTPTP